jgi:hypothetical protein
LRFALEAAAGGRVGEVVGKKLDRNGSIEFGIERAIDHTHAAGAEWRLHHVHAEPKACQDRGPGLAHNLRCDRSGGPVQKILRARRATQKRLHFESETIIATAFAIEESLTLARWSFQRRVVEPLDLAPAFGVHGLVVDAVILRRIFFSVAPDGHSEEVDLLQIRANDIPNEAVLRFPPGSRLRRFGW